MDVETAIQAFASAGNDLPREAMQWALDHWDEVAPELLSVVERYTSGADRSDETASAVFFILHLAGEKQDTRVFPLLCRLAQDGEAIEAALGDGTTTTFKQILISTYDGDLDTLKGLIEAAEADEFVRAVVARLMNEDPEVVTKQRQLALEAAHIRNAEKLATIAMLKEENAKLRQKNRQLLEQFEVLTERLEPARGQIL